jgi:hypothetical protein
MRRKLTVHRPAPGHLPSTRLAWWAAFLVTVALIALLNAVRADAAALPGSAPSLPALAAVESEEEDEEEGELAEEEAEEEPAFGEVECDPEEEVECVVEAEEGWPPRECLLRSTEATVSAYPHRARVVLTVRYAAPVPTRVEISYRFRGSRGGLKMNTERRRFAGTGSLRDAQTMSPAQMKRVLAAKTFTVEIRPLGAPSYCHAYFDHRLGVRRATPRGPIWID